MRALFLALVVYFCADLAIPLEPGPATPRGRAWWSPPPLHAVARSDRPASPDAP